MRNRRELLSAVGGVTLVGLAGCTGDSSEPDPEPESDQSEQQTTDSDSETEDGLQLDFTAQDMWEKKHNTTKIDPAETSTEQNQ